MAETLTKKRIFWNSTFMYLLLMAICFPIFLFIEAFPNSLMVIIALFCFVINVQTYRKMMDLIKKQEETLDLTFDFEMERWSVPVKRFRAITQGDWFIHITQGVILHRDYVHRVELEMKNSLFSRKNTILIIEGIDDRVTSIRVEQYGVAENVLNWSSKKG